MSNAQYIDSPANWEVLTNDGSNITARHRQSGEEFSGTTADFNAKFSGAVVYERQNDNEYISNYDPNATVNPADTGVMWTNKITGLVFICTDNTRNENKWRKVQTNTVRNPMRSDYEVLIDPDIDEVAGVNYKSLQDAWDAGYFSCYLKPGSVTPFPYYLFEATAWNFNDYPVVCTGTDKSNPGKLQISGKSLMFDDLGNAGACTHSGISGSTIYPDSVDLTTMTPVTQNKDGALIPEGGGGNFAACTVGYGDRSIFAFFQNQYSGFPMAIDREQAGNIIIMSVPGPWRNNQDCYPVEGGFPSTGVNLAISGGVAIEWRNVVFTDEANMYSSFCISLQDGYTLPEGKVLKVVLKDMDTGAIVETITHTAGAGGESGTTFASALQATLAASTTFGTAAYTVSNQYQAAYVKEVDNTQPNPIYKIELSTDSDALFHICPRLDYGLFFETPATIDSYAMMPVNNNFLGVDFDFCYQGSFQYDLMPGTLMYDCNFQQSFLYNEVKEQGTTRLEEYFTGMGSLVIECYGPSINCLDAYAGGVMMVRCSGVDGAATGGSGLCSFFDCSFSDSYMSDYGWYGTFSDWFGCVDSVYTYLGQEQNLQNNPARGMFIEIARRAVAIGCPDVTGYCV